MVADITPAPAKLQTSKNTDHAKATGKNAGSGSSPRASLKKQNIFGRAIFGWKQGQYLNKTMKHDEHDEKQHQKLK